MLLEWYWILGGRLVQLSRAGGHWCKPPLKWTNISVSNALRYLLNIIQPNPQRWEIKKTWISIGHHITSYLATITIHIYSHAPLWSSERDFRVGPIVKEGSEDSTRTVERKCRPFYSDCSTIHGRLETLKKSQFDILTSRMGQKIMLRTHQLHGDVCGSNPTLRQKNIFSDKTFFFTYLL